MFCLSHLISKGLGVKFASILNLLLTQCSTLHRLDFLDYFFVCCQLENVQKRTFFVAAPGHHEPTVFVDIDLGLIAYVSRE